MKWVFLSGFVCFLHLSLTWKRCTSRQVEGINNFGSRARKYNFVHKIQFRGRAYQNTLRPWNFLNICKCQRLCKTTVGNIFSNLIQNPIHRQLTEFLSATKSEPSHDVWWAHFHSHWLAIWRISGSEYEIRFLCIFKTRIKIQWFPNLEDLKMLGIWMSPLNLILRKPSKFR